MSETSNSDSTAIGLDGLIKMSRDKDSSYGEQKTVQIAGSTISADNKSRTTGTSLTATKSQGKSKQKAVKKPGKKK